MYSRPVPVPDRSRDLSGVHDSAKGEPRKSSRCRHRAFDGKTLRSAWGGRNTSFSRRSTKAIADARRRCRRDCRKATVESARINFAYTSDCATSGRIGKSTVTGWALLSLGRQTIELATVQQPDPIYVDVTQSSNDFMRPKQSVDKEILHMKTPPATCRVGHGKRSNLSPERYAVLSDVTVTKALLHNPTCCLPQPATYAFAGYVCVHGLMKASNLTLFLSRNKALAAHRVVMQPC